MFFLGTFIIIRVFVFANLFIELLVPGFSEQDKELATFIFRTLLPYLYLQIFTSFFITVLNAEEKFGRAELLGVTNTIINITSLVVLYPFIGIWALVISLLLGKLIEFIFYLLQLYKIGFRYKLILKSTDFDHNSFFKTLRSTFLYVGATQIYSIILTASISFLPEGVYAIFKYVQNLGNKIKGLFIQPFVTIFFTKYSQLLQSSKSLFNEFKKNIQSVFKMNTVIIIGVILLGTSILDFLWGNKKFSAENVSLAQLFLVFNVLGIFFSSLGSLYRKMAMSHGRGKELYRLWSLTQLISGLLSFLLIKYFKVNGLLFVIPINVLLLSLVSYIQYRRTSNPLRFNYLNRKNIESIFLITLAIAIKFVLDNYGGSYLDTHNVLFSIIATILLCLRPIYLIYKTFTSQ
jgi:putative peptidoglycan lipid II flippase